MKSSSNFINEISIDYSKKTFSFDSINSVTDAQLIAREIYKNAEASIELKEYFFIILLNRANEVIGYHKLSEGGIAATVVDMRIAFATALKGLATGIILVHNHPSGNLKASPQDKEITEKFKRIGDLMEITILDHIILSSTKYLSFVEAGLL
jgi:DNA repair protein RadC